MLTGNMLVLSRDLTEISGIQLLDTVEVAVKKLQPKQPQT